MIKVWILLRLKELEDTAHRVTKTNMQEVKAMDNLTRRNRKEMLDLKKSIVLKEIGPGDKEFKDNDTRRKRAVLKGIGS